MVLIRAEFDHHLGAHVNDADLYLTKSPLLLAQHLLRTTIN
jgi:hypothetical protein